MTVDEFITIRKRLGFTQTQLANHFGMSLRAVQDIENRRTELRFIHVLALERIIITCVAAGEDHSVMPENVLTDVLAAAQATAQTN